jgi:transcriptional regulator with XRE-family HTH domain
MKRTRSYTPLTTEAARLLGSEIELARREHRWTLDELADRIGVSPATMRRIEQGEPTVGLGVAFEAAAIAGVPLFGEDPARRRLESARTDDRLALLPKRVRRPRAFNDEF